MYVPISDIANPKKIAKNKVQIKQAKAKIETAIENINHSLFSKSRQ